MNIHLNKKDFKIEWYSGTGPGGQNRNKNQNCCRITHIESGLSSISTEKERMVNLKKAFLSLSDKLVKYYKWMEAPKMEVNTSVIRNYNKSRNEVHDYESGLKKTYKEIVDKCNIKPMIDVRKKEKEIKS